MGLDQFAYAASRDGQRQDSWEDASVPKPVELAYWRKHPNLQGWMERLWLSKLTIPAVESDQFIENRYPPCDFNGIELELDREDIDRLERDIENGELAKLETTGFFFGNPSDDYYREQDLKFCRDARANLFLGLRVFYNSSW